jgi:DNA polymerase V
MYLAKVAMDIVAKKAPADKDGVRIAELNEESYKYLLWDHQPLTDFWQIGPGKARRLNNAGMFTMGMVAAESQRNEEWFYKTFGIDAEILIDHAWGIEPVCMSDIKNYHASAHSLSLGQVLARPYSFPEARIVFIEMIDNLCADLYRKHLKSRTFVCWISYDAISLERCPDYDGPLCMDFYGRIFPKYTGGTVRFHNRTNSTSVVRRAMLEVFDRKVNHDFYIRRFGVVAADTLEGDTFLQLDLFTDYEALDKEQRIQEAMRIIRERYGSNAVLKGTNYMEGGTARVRNEQIGGHRA